jgi:hypothetical protein
MARHRLNADWTYDVGAGFRGSVVRGDLHLTGSKRQVVFALFVRDPDDPAEELARLLTHAAAIPPERIDEIGEHGELRHAHWSAKRARDRTDWALEGYTVTARGLVRSTFLFEDPEDLQWAIDGWRSVRPRPGR